MNKLIILGLVAGFLFFAPVSGWAEDAKETKHDRVQIIEGDEAGVVRIVIDGKEVILIDADGMHVTGDFDYTGTITDIGIPSQPKKDGE